MHAYMLTYMRAHRLRGSYSKQKQGTIASTRPAEVIVAWIAALQVAVSRVHERDTACVCE